jgi:DNA-binding transcriptional regulator LsrR (DeoR family)
MLMRAGEEMTDNSEFEATRQIHTVLVMHFLDGQKQSDIAEMLNLSTSKVNRLIAQGRKLGMVRIEINSPFERLVQMEQLLVQATRLSSAVVTPAISGNLGSTLRQVGRAAANQLLESLRDGDVIAITGGKAISAVVDNIDPERSFDVTVVPLTGGVQGKYYTDVNHLASRLAERLGGKTHLMLAPLFAESVDQRDMLMQLPSVKETLHMARQAAIALVGIGSIQTPGSSYYDLNPNSTGDREHLIKNGVVAEFLAHLVSEDGKVANYSLNSRLVALAPCDLSNCRKVIGVAAGAEKAMPIRAVLNGGYLDSLVVDEETAAKVLEGVDGQYDAS